MLNTLQCIERERERERETERKKKIHRWFSIHTRSSLRLGSQMSRLRQEQQIESLFVAGDPFPFVTLQSGRGRLQQTNCDRDRDDFVVTMVAVSLILAVLATPYQCFKKNVYTYYQKDTEPVYHFLCTHFYHTSFRYLTFTCNAFIAGDIRCKKYLIGISQK